MCKDVSRGISTATSCTVQDLPLADTSSLERTGSTEVDFDTDERLNVHRGLATTFLAWMMVSWTPMKAAPRLQDADQTQWF